MEFTAGRLYISAPAHSHMPCSASAELRLFSKLRIENIFLFLLRAIDKKIRGCFGMV